MVPGKKWNGNFTKDRDIHRAMVMCGIHLIEKKISMDLMLMLGFNETMDQFSITNSVHWYGHVLRREDGHVLRRALDFEGEGQRKKWRPERM